jgi:glycosyltransferase involved in cell wall biosynthesis
MVETSLSTTVCVDPGRPQVPPVPIRIACIHQGYELYGSDRAFAESVAALRGAYPDADIEVVLPRAGPILPLLEPHASRFAIEPLFVLRRKTLARTVATAPASLPLAVLRAVRRLRSCDLAYINTSVIIDYALATRLVSCNALLHIHEIPEGRSRAVFRALALGSRAKLIFNSRATREAFAPPAGREARIIYNGVRGPLDWRPSDYDGRRALRVLMLGRINRIKGQEVLLEALAGLAPALRGRIEARLVGSAFEDPDAEAALRASVAAMGLEEIVSVEPFCDDPAPLYHWADVVAMPSRRPESLGRVAIEAMAFGRPPLASAIGGLGEVVVDRETGRLLPPGDAAALGAAIAEIVAEPERLRPYAIAGRARYEALFSEAAAAASWIAAAAEALAGATRP